MEDLDRVTSSLANAAAQLADLAALGMVPSGDVVFQSDRFERYRAAVSELAGRGLVYECYCTRREIREATQAPHGDSMAYPGTCRELTSRQRAAHQEAGRTPALRLLAGAPVIGFDDIVAGPFSGIADDVVLQRNDGVPAYNLAVVVDDADQGVTLVVRGDDLLSVTPSHIHVQRMLGLATPVYAHIPLAVGADGARLAKRHGAVTLADLTQRGWARREVLAMLASSLGIDVDVTTGLGSLREAFDWGVVPREPWVVPDDLARSAP